jgi:hypothetical protein
MPSNCRVDRLGITAADLRENQLSKVDAREQLFRSNINGKIDLLVSYLLGSKERKIIHLVMRRSFLMHDVTSSLWWSTSLNF